jgi:hypothetical protein
MATAATPYGLKPVKRADGLPYAGATTTYLVDPAGEATNIFYGQVVYIGADGYLAIVVKTGIDATTNSWPAGSTDNTGAIGVFVGCEYVNTEGQVIHSQYYPSGTTGVVKCKVVDDPGVLFQAQLDAVSGQDDVGSNCHFVAAQSTSTGSTTTGNSTSALDATVIQTTAPFRILGFVSPTDDTYPDVLVKINPAWHTMSIDKGV